jgi:hypothetical protein
MAPVATNNPRVSPRLDPETIERLDRLAVAMNAVKRRGTLPLDRAGLARLLILRALATHERRYGLTPPEAPKAKRKATRKGKAFGIIVGPPNPGDRDD